MLLLKRSCILPSMLAVLAVCSAFVSPPAALWNRPVLSPRGSLARTPPQPMAIGKVGHGTKREAAVLMVDIARDIATECVRDFVRTFDQIFVAAWLSAAVLGILGFVDSVPERFRVAKRSRTLAMTRRERERRWKHQQESGFMKNADALSTPLPLMR